MENKLATTNPYVLASTQPKIYQMVKREATDRISETLAKTFYEAGQKITPAELALLSTALYSECNLLFKNITTGDLGLALANGVRGMYGEYFGLNIATFNRWVRHYAQSEERKQAKQINETTYEPKMSKQQAEKDFKRAINEQFKHYKKTGELQILFPIILFKDFEANGLIKITLEQKKVIFDEAKKKLIQELRATRANPRSMNEVRTLTDAINNLEADIVTDYYTQKIRNRACSIAIKQYYDSITELVF